MGKYYDIMLDEDYDLAVANGDFVAGECLNQQQALLLMAVPGDYKQYPTTGVGLSVLDENETEVKQEIRVQFKKDGLVIKQLKKVDGNLVIVADHES